MHITHMKICIYYSLLIKVAIYKVCLCFIVCQDFVLYSMIVHFVVTKLLRISWNLLSIIIYEVLGIAFKV